MKAVGRTLLTLASALALTACEPSDPFEYEGLWEYTTSSHVEENCAGDSITIDIEGEILIEATEHELFLSSGDCTVSYVAPSAGNVFDVEATHFCDSRGTVTTSGSLGLHGDRIDQTEEGRFFDGIWCDYRLTGSLVRVPGG